MSVRIFVLALVVVASLTAAESGKKKTTRVNTATAATTSTTPGPPKTAVETTPGVFRYVDARGKVWIYRRTPFGWMKAEEKEGQQNAATSAAPVAETRVVVDGNNVRFERNTPFGVQRWTRKKSELTEEEKRIFEGASRAVGTAESAKPSTQE